MYVHSMRMCMHARIDLTDEACAMFASSGGCLLSERDANCATKLDEQVGAATRTHARS